MAEIKMFAEQVTQNLQTIGLLATALGCCYVQFKDRVRAVKHFNDLNFYNRTGRIVEVKEGETVVQKSVGNKNLPSFMQLQFSAHDHQVDDLTPKKDQLVVEILDDGLTGDKIQTIIVNKEEVVTMDHLNQGDNIQGTEHKHDHAGKHRIGPWEHQ